MLYSLDIFCCDVNVEIKLRLLVVNLESSFFAVVFAVVFNKLFSFIPGKFDCLSVDTFTSHFIDLNQHFISFPITHDC